MLALLSWQPAVIAGLDGHARRADRRRATPPTSASSIPTAEWIVDPAAMASRSRNTPYAGRKVTGRVRHTILAGEPVVIDGEAQR